jgi:hypothetical protein
MSAYSPNLRAVDNDYVEGEVLDGGDWRRRGAVSPYARSMNEAARYHVVVQNVSQLAIRGAEGMALLSDRADSLSGPRPGLAPAFVEIEYTCLDLILQTMRRYVQRCT